MHNAPIYYYITHTLDFAPRTRYRCAHIYTMYKSRFSKNGKKNFVKNRT